MFQGAMWHAITQILLWKHIKWWSQNLAEKWTNPAVLEDKTKIMTAKKYRIRRSKTTNHILESQAHYDMKQNLIKNVI